MNTTYYRSLDEQVLDDLLAAIGLAPDDAEYESALLAIGEWAAAFDELPGDAAVRLVAEVEDALGLGLDEQQHAAAVGAVQRCLQPPRPPDPEPDAFLEMAYEDRVSGNIE